MDELDNHTLSLLLLLDDHLFPLFLEWCAGNGLSDMVLFLLEADFLRYKSDENFRLIIEKRSMSSIAHHINKIMQLVTEKRYTYTSHNVVEFHHIKQVLSADSIQCYDRLKRSGLPLYAVFNTLADAVWEDLLFNGKNVISSPQWASLRRALIAAHNEHSLEGNENATVLDLDVVLREPALCKYFERFLQHDPSELASLHCLVLVQKLLSQVSGFKFPSDPSESCENKHLKEKAYSERAQIDIFEVFKILLNGTRNLQKQFFPAGIGFLSTFSLSTMIGGLRRNSGASTNVVNCAGLSEALRVEIAATLGLNSSVRTEEVESIDKIYAVNCSDVIKQLLLALEKEMLTFLSMKFDMFKTASDDYAVMVAFLQCRNNDNVLKYKKKTEFLYDLVRREQVIHWADSRARGTFFTTICNKQKDLYCDGNEDDSKYVDDRTVKADSHYDKSLRNLGSLSVSSPIVAFKANLLIPSCCSCLSADQLGNYPCYLRSWATRDKLLMTQRNKLILEIGTKSQNYSMHHQTHNNGVASIEDVATNLFGGGYFRNNPITENPQEDTLSSSSSDYGETVPIHLISGSLDDSLLFGNPIDEMVGDFTDTEVLQESLKSTPIDTETMLMELDSSKMEKLLCSTVDHNNLEEGRSAQPSTLMSIIVDSLENAGLLVNDCAYQDNRLVSFCVNNPSVGKLFKLLFGSDFSVGSSLSCGDHSTFMIHARISTMPIDEESTIDNIKELVGQDMCDSYILSDFQSRFAPESGRGTKVSFAVEESCLVKYKAAISIAVSMVPLHHSHCPFHISKCIGERIVETTSNERVQSNNKPQNGLSTLGVYDPYSSIWCELLSRVNKVATREAGNMLDFFRYPDQKGLCDSTDSIYDIYLGSYPMSYDMMSVFKDIFSNSNSIPEDIWTVIQDFQSAVLKSWPITKKFGPSDFPFVSIIDRAGLSFIIQMIILLLTSQSVMIVSFDRALLGQLILLLPRLLHPFDILGKTHEIQWINNSEELRTVAAVTFAEISSPSGQKIQNNKANHYSQRNDSFKSQLTLVDANSYAVVRDDVVSGRATHKELPMVVFDMDSMSITKLFHSSHHGDTGDTGHDLRNPQLYDLSSPILQRLDILFKKIKKSYDCGLSKTVSKGTHRNVAFPLLVLVTNSSVEMAFHNFLVDLILAPLPECVQFFPQLKIVSCSMQQMLSELLCRHQFHDMELQCSQLCNYATGINVTGQSGMHANYDGGDRHHYLSKQELEKCSFEDFLALYNQETIRSSVCLYGTKHYSFVHAFYANYLVGLSPSFVEFLQRHGRIIDGLRF